MEQKISRFLRRRFRIDLTLDRFPSWIRRAFAAMRAVVQRVKRAEVRVAGEAVGRIGCGFLVLLGVGKDDTEAAGETLAEIIVNLRVFDDEQGRMNRSLQETGGQALCVSQFTLYGDCRKGRRPSYDHAAGPDRAELLYESFVASLRRGESPPRRDASVP